MNYSILAKENLLNLLGLVILSVGFITIIGYFDEGHANIYGSFSNYLASGGYPPAPDYLMWSMITVLFGTILFNLISKSARESFPLLARLIFTILTIPFIIITFLSIFVCLVYGYRMLL